MEPADLNSSSDEDRRLEALLRRAAPMLPDVDFPQRVLTALPPKRARASAAAARWAWCAAGGLAGVAVVWKTNADGRAAAAFADRLTASASHLNDTLASMPATTNGAWLLISLGVTLASLLVAFLPASLRAPRA